MIYLNYAVWCVVPAIQPVCRDVLLDFVGDCREVLSQIPAGMTQIDEFTTSCQKQHADSSTDHAAQKALDALRQRKVPRYQCSYAELTGIALTCTSVPAVLGTDTLALCGSACVTQLLPFGEQCGDAMAVAFASLGLRRNFDRLQQICETTDPKACPIDHITETCQVDRLPADVDLLCKTPCVKIVTRYFSQCSRRGADTRTKMLFSTANWEAVIQTCASRRSSAEQGGDNTKGQATQQQCARIQPRMTVTLAKLCCANGVCSSLPATCSLTCSVR